MYLIFLMALMLMFILCIFNIHLHSAVYVDIFNNLWRYWILCFFVFYSLKNLPNEIVLVGEWSKLLEAQQQQQQQYIWVWNKICDKVLLYLIFEQFKTIFWLFWLAQLSHKTKAKFWYMLDAGCMYSSATYYNRIIEFVFVFFLFLAFFNSKCIFDIW